MKEFWSPRIQDMVPYVPGEQPKNRTFIKLNTNENPYPPSPLALEAMRSEIGGNLRLYPDPEVTELRETIAHHAGLKPEEVFVGNGSDEVLAFAFQAFFDPAKEIVFADVTYSFYPVYANFFGQPYREIPLTENFALDAEEFMGNNGGVILANPNAPTGREVPMADIREILKKNPDVVVVVDEAYVDFGGRSALELIPDYPNLLVVRTLSKSRSLAGLRVGFALGNENLIAALNCVKNSINSYTIDRVALVGATAAMNDKGYFGTTVLKIMYTREKTAARLKGLGFDVCDSRANFLFVTHKQIGAKMLLDGLRDRGILVRWWDKPRISNYLRITIGTEQEMDALYTALEELVQ